jgi:hypothetical protein
MLAVVVAAIVAPVLIAGASYALQRPKELTAAPVDLAVPAFGGDQLGQWCVDRKAAGTAGLSDRSKRWLADCIALFGSDLSPTSQPTAEPSTPTTNPTAPGSGAPAPTTPGTTAPGTTAPSSTQPAGPTAPSSGFPNASNTGARGTLTAVQGNVTLSTAGQVYEGRDVSGCITVTAPNVTIRNVKVTCGQFWGINYQGQGGGRMLVEDTTVVCTGFNAGRSIGDSNYTTRRVNVTGCADGWNADHDVLIEDSYCHDQPSELDSSGHDNGLHVDCIQGVQTSNVTIRHNTLIAPFYATSAIGGCCIPGATVRTNWQVVNNLLDGGGFTIYCFRAGTEVNSIVSGNRFGPGGWNHSYADDCNDGGLVWTGNVRDATGASLPAQ